MSNLIDFEERLLAITPKDPACRPFLCEGDPYACKIFLVGINPATTVNFWDHWRPNDGGCSKTNWMDAYLARHGKLSPTRSRIERNSSRCPVLT